MLWWGRNIVTYPGPDFLGTAMHNRVVVGQLETSDWVAEIGVGEAVRLFGRNSFRSFWGQFGWMCCPMPSWTYPPLALLTLAGIIGFIIQTIRYYRADKHGENSYLIAFAGLLTLNLLLFLTYNLSFVQHQARYLFVSLIPIALLLTLGWSLWFQWLRERLKLPVYLLPIGLIIGLTGLNLLIIRSTLPCMSVAGC
ncbi:MAG TPA: hypothetical protein ENJ56_05530 [Anaerolineae bacterium]|nr:hypothetical protein [Anaerolineae bacterium]